MGAAGAGQGAKALGRHCKNSQPPGLSAGAQADIALNPNSPPSLVYFRELVSSKKKVNAECTEAYPQDAKIETRQLD